MCSKNMCQRSLCACVKREKKRIREKYTQQRDSQWCILCKRSCHIRCLSVCVRVSCMHFDQIAGLLPHAADCCHFQNLITAAEKQKLVHIHAYTRAHTHTQEINMSVEHMRALVRHFSSSFQSNKLN